jgi:hypothetical protein
VKTLSYDEILRKDAEEYNSCEFDWNCKKCYKTLCLRIVAIADFPSKYGSFKVMAFENKDGKDHIMIVKGDVVGFARAISLKTDKPHGSEGQWT